MLSSFKLPVASSKESPVCTACLGAKSKQLPFASTSGSANCPLALIYTDVWGPAPVSYRTGAKYYVSFLDAYTKYTWPYPISLKSDVISIFTTFKSYVERFFNTKIKAIQSDWGGEYHTVNTLLQKLGIAPILTNKMVLSNGNIDILSKSVYPYSLMLIYPSNFGMMPFPLHPI